MRLNDNPTSMIEFPVIKQKKLYFILCSIVIKAISFSVTAPASFFFYASRESLINDPRIVEKIPQKMVIPPKIVTAYRGSISKCSTKKSFTQIINPPIVKL